VPRRETDADLYVPRRETDADLYVPRRERQRGRELSEADGGRLGFLLRRWGVSRSAGPPARTLSEAPAKAEGEEASSLRESHGCSTPG
jgi:hypothetical protein